MIILQIMSICIISSAFCHKFNRNVGTVLFTEIDISKKCWSREDIALLESRKVFQDLLPAADILRLEDDKFVHVLLEYFYGSFAIVQKQTSGKSKHLMLQSMSDAIAGYLYSFVLPLTRRAFYGGTVSYASAKKLFDFFEELKLFLKTNGDGWAKPEQNFGNLTFSIEPLVIKPPEDKEACKGILVHEENNQQRSAPSKTVIPLPFLDNKENPASIALPFKKHPLRSLQSPAAAFILVKYYVAANHCLISKSATKNDLSKFARSFHSWLKEEVLPHLKEEKWYPGFGGVLRIIETMKKEGIVGISGNWDYTIMPHVKVADPERPSIYDKLNPLAKSVKEKYLLEHNKEEVGSFRTISPIKSTTTSIEPLIYKRTSKALYISFIIMFILLTLCVVLPGFYIVFTYCVNKEESRRKPKRRTYKKPKKHKKICPPCESDEECEPLCPNYAKKHKHITHLQKKKSPLNTFVQIFYTPSNADGNNSANSFEYPKSGMDIELVENPTTGKDVPVENVYGPKKLASSNLTYSSTMRSKSAQISLDPAYTLESTNSFKNAAKNIHSDPVVVASNLSSSDYSSSSEEENSSSKKSLQQVRIRKALLKESIQKYKGQTSTQSGSAEDNTRTMCSSIEDYNCGNLKREKSGSGSVSKKGNLKKDRNETSVSSRRVVTDKCILNSNCNTFDRSV